MGIRPVWLVVLLAAVPGVALPAPDIPAPTVPVEVVFLLGEDTPGKPEYFSVAEAYFRRAEPEARLVTSLRSLAEVREYLSRQRGPRPWRQVTLVAHGAPWIGLHAPVFPGDGDAGLDTVLRAHADGSFPVLPADVVDADTRIRLDSCGLGRRPDYLAAIARLFGDPAHLPQVSSSTQFVAFRVGEDTAERLDLPFDFAVLTPGPDGVDPRTEQAAIDALAGTLPPGQTLMLRYPVRARVQVPGRWNRARPTTGLDHDPGLAARLRDHGLRVDQLRWRPVDPRADGEGIVLEGRAVFLMVRSRLTDAVSTGAPP